MSLESNGVDNAIGDRGKAVGVLQIHKVCVDDVNRILGRPVFTYKDRLHRGRSIRMAMVYLTYWGKKYKRRTGLEPTPEVFARIFNGGPRGASKNSTIKYAKKFKELYDRSINKESRELRPSDLIRRSVTRTRDKEAATSS